MTSNGLRTFPWPGLIEAYRDRLPVTDATPVITLHEGNTPLVPAPRLSERTGCDVMLKVEGANPTGSFKDRGMTVAISKAVEAGTKVVVCASTGNTSASAAAYAARAGVLCAVLLPEGHVALGKLAQALIYGARTVQIRGNFDDALDIVRQLGTRDDITIVNSINPHRIEGQKTQAFEIVDARGDAPHVHCIPVGNAGNVTAVWKGYKEYERDGRHRARCRACSAGRPPARRRWCRASRCRTPRRSPRRSVSATRPRGRVRSTRATSRVATSARSPTSAILDAYRFLAAAEGVFVEPASAASVAGLFAAADQGLVEPGESVVCTVTGHGLKDPNRAIAEVDEGVTVDAKADAVLDALGL